MPRPFGQGSGLPRPTAPSVNQRRQKLTEMAGTNPSKAVTGINPSKAVTGSGSIKDKPGPKGFSDGYTQDSAPHKAAAAKNTYDFSVGGPGFPKPWK